MAATAGRAPHGGPSVQLPLDDPPSSDPRTNAELRARLRACTVAIIGCGGLGSNAAQMLVRSGIGRLVLVDHDRVEEDNLNRQFFFRDQIGMLKTEALAENLRRIQPDVDLSLMTERVSSQTLIELVRSADVIIEAVDTAEAKAMIMDVCTRDLPDVPLVTASGLAGHGSANAIVTERLSDNLYVVGDLTSDVRSGLALFASRVGVAAAAEAHMVVRLLLGYPEP